MIRDLRLLAQTSAVSSNHNMLTNPQTERTHEENQERAYIAASRRSDRSIEARVESARRASEIHKKRTGRALKVTEQDVINEDMYEEEDEDLPRHMRAFTAHLQTGSADFNTRLANFVIVHFGSMEAASEAIKKAEVERLELERRGQSTAHLNLANFMPQYQGNTMSLQHQMARQQQQLFGHPMPQQYAAHSLAPNMMHMNAQPQISYSQSPYGMQSQQQLQMNQQYAIPQHFNHTSGMGGQVQHVQPMQLNTGSSLQVPFRVRSGSARSIHSNSPLPPAQSPSMLMSAQIRERSASATTPIPSIEEESNQNSMTAKSRNTQNRASISNNSNSSGNRSNEYLPQEVTADSLLSMPDYQYGVNADIFATATPQGTQGGSGYFESHHFAHSGFDNDPLQAMFQMGSAVRPFENDLHNSYSTNANYGVKQENGQVASPGHAAIAPKQINTTNAAVNQYLQRTEESKATVLADGGDPRWNDWTEGGDYNSELDVE